MEKKYELLPFVCSLANLLFTLHIHDPPLHCAWDTIGAEVSFSALHHDAIDGFIKPGELCITILPSVSKSSGDCVIRAGVLHIDYDLDF